MSGRGEDDAPGPPEPAAEHSDLRLTPGAKPDPAQGAALADVLASIRTRVSAETAARRDPPAPAEGVLMLTAGMRVDPADDDDESGPGRGGGDILAEGIGPQGPPALRTGAAPGQPAPILDEEALRGVINALVREELQGELGERISRNLRKLIRREIAQIEDETRRS